MDNFNKILVNPYNLDYSYKNKKVDYYGYLAYKFTEFKKDKIFIYDVKTRSFGVFLPVLMMFKLNKSIFKKFYFGGLSYFFTSLVIAPELINPYYNSNNCKFDIEEYLKIKKYIN